MLNNRYTAVLGTVWCSPMTILIWLGWVLPLWAFGLVHFTRRHGWVFEFVADLGGPAWWARAWEGWRGHAVPQAIILARDPELVSDLASWERTVRHELRHTAQWRLLGVFFLPAYAVAGAWAVLRGGGFYHDNWFERDARRSEDSTNG